MRAQLEEGRAWLDRHGSEAVVVPHHDADGLSAGALLVRHTGGAALHVDSPWHEPLPPVSAAVIADWGIRPVLGPDRVLYVDHHAGAERVTGAVVTPEVAEETSTSLLAWELLGRPPEGAWLALLGAFGDFGDPALNRFGAPRVSSRSALKRLAPLITAAGRLKQGPVAEALQLLVEASDPATALAAPECRLLEQAKQRVNAARTRALKTPPRMGTHAALIRFSEPVRVHPLVATAWARRLAPRVVVAANDGWRNETVSFAVRSSAERDLRAWLLERYRPPKDAGDYAHGHPQATGGTLTHETFEAFAEAILGQ